MLLKTFFHSKNRYLKNGKTGMTIMDIGVFSGFTPDKDSLVEVKEIELSCLVIRLFTFQPNATRASEPGGSLYWHPPVWVNSIAYTFLLNCCS